MQTTLFANARNLQQTSCPWRQTVSWPAQYTSRAGCAKSHFSARSFQSRRHNAVGCRVSASFVEAALDLSEGDQKAVYAAEWAPAVLPGSPGNGLTRITQHTVCKMDAIYLANSMPANTKNLKVIAHEQLPANVQLRVHEILENEQKLLSSLEGLLERPAAVGDNGTWSSPDFLTQAAEPPSIASHPITLQPKFPELGDAVSESVVQMLPNAWAGVAATRGSRSSMEDVSVIHTLHPELGVLSPAQYQSSNDSMLLTGVFDGHGGSSTASYVAAQLPELLHQQLKSTNPAANHHEILSQVFAQLDQAWHDHGHVEQSGSTAVVALLENDKLTIANAGDSVAVLGRGGQAVRLSSTDNLNNPDEVARVTAAGGQVVQGNKGGYRLMQSPARVQRYVAPLSVVVTRGFGDFGFKGVGGDLVIPTPHVSELQLTPADQLLLLTSDGVTDVLSDEDMLQIAMAAIHKAKQETIEGSRLAAAAASAVKEKALSLGAWDNLTVVALLLDWTGV